MCRQEREVLFGGAAGPGKSSALLMAALMFADVPGYSALILRRTYADLSLPGAIMDRAHEWLGPTDAAWNDVKKTWRFPSGATLTFGYLDSARDHFRYQGSELQFIGWDELTQFSEAQYRYVLSRLRKLEGEQVPLRVRSASNPGGIGHDWVFGRFVKEQTADRAFVPAALDDNPHLNREEYRKSLEDLDDVTRDQLLKGLWVKDEGASIYKREWFRDRFDISDTNRRNLALARYIFVDTAFKKGEENDYTSWGVYDLMPDYTVDTVEVGWERLEFAELTTTLEDVALRHNADAKLGGVVIEDKGSGTSALQALGASSWLAPYLSAFKPKGSKEERAREASVWDRRGCGQLPGPSAGAPWLHGFEEMLFSFPNVEHDDPVDVHTMSRLYLAYLLEEGLRFRGVA